ncbi:hypothetical protein T01_9469, partial [Trichinella spiralis]
LWPQALPSGYAPGQIKICICPKAIPQAIYSTIFDLRGKFSPRRRLRLCPRVNKNLHIPAGYAESILLHNICLQGGYANFHLLLGYAQGIPSGFPQWIEKMYKNLNGLHHQHRVDVRSYSCVSLSWLNGVTQYCSRNMCGFACRRKYYVSSLWPQALPSGYAPGQIKICICPKAIPQAIYSTIFDLRGGNMQIFICPQATPGAMPQAIFRNFRNFSKFSRRRRLRLCPRANKNLHIPAGYAESILLHNICL